ncbi:MAG: SusD/RagB family nutrient-binding outer membrane lipoprotein [Prolixibacteraceae bacterium]
MKKIFIIVTVLVFALGSCTSNFEDMNTDKKNPAVVPGEPLFSNAQKELADYTSNTNVNINIFKLMAQYWTETTYIDEANYDLVTRNISANIYFRLYLRVLTDLKEATKIIGETEVLASEEAAKKNKLQIIELMNVYVYAHMVDVFGAIPYTDALDVENVYPKYDNGADIYKDLFVRINAALANLDAGSGSFGSADLYYGGDVAAWIMFGNTLKVRMGITIADADNAAAKTAIEAAAGKAFGSNSDDCLMGYLTSSPNFNQLYADLVATGRHDFVPANTLVGKMSVLDDPRMAAYFADMQTVAWPKDEQNVRQNDSLFVEEPILFHYSDGSQKLVYPGALKTGGDDKFGIVVPQADTIYTITYYIGGDYGYSNSFSQYSHISDKVQAPDFEGIILTYSELCFYLAEAAERGYSVGGSAEEWYNKGIEASFDFWGVAGASTYLVKGIVAYNTAPGTWKEKIGTQAWLANYTRGIEGYTTWRRLDYPIFNLPEQAVDYTDIPVRFTFPVNEQTLNADNYAAAAAAIGGDDIKTKIFWDKN